MATWTEHAPAGGEPRRARPAVFRTLAIVLGSAFGLFLLGAALAVMPIPMIGLMGGLGYVWLCLRWPIQAVAAFLFVHIVFPAYIHIPPSVPLPPSVGMLAVLVGAVLLDILVRRRGGELGPRGHRFAMIFLIFGAVGLFSLMDPRSNGDSLNMWIKVFVFPAVTAWVIVHNLRDEADIRRVYDVMLAAACVTALYGIYEWVIGSNYLFENFMDPTVTEATMYRTADVLGSAVAYRSFSVSSQPIEFGAWLSMMVPYALVRFTRAPTFPWRALFAVAFGVLLLGIMVTFSRGCLLAATVASVAMGIILPPLRKWLLAAVIILVLALAAVWSTVGDKVADRAGDIGNVTLRFKLWQTAFAIFQDNPVKGVGLGNFPLYQLDTVRRHEIGPFYEFGLDQAELIGVAEQTFLQLAAETGVIGLASYGALLLGFFILAARLAIQGSNQACRDLALCVAVSGIAYLVNGLTITAYTHYITTLMFMGAFFGFLMVLARAEHGRGKTEVAAGRPLSSERLQFQP